MGLGLKFRFDRDCCKIVFFKWCLVVLSVLIVLLVVGEDGLIVVVMVSIFI